MPVYSGDNSTKFHNPNLAQNFGTNLPDNNEYYILRLFGKLPPPPDKFRS